MQDLTIKKAADKAGVGVETIRFYERRGLIEQPRKPDRGTVVREGESVPESSELLPTRLFLSPGRLDCR